MNTIDTIDFFEKNIKGETTNHLVFSTVHSLKGFLEPKFFIGKKHVQIDITHDNGDILRFTLNTKYDIDRITAVYTHIDHGVKLYNDYKLKIKQPATFKDYMLENYDHNQLADISNHGCAGGSACTLIYYSDTCKVYDQYVDDIWDMIYKQCEDMGCEDNVISHIGSFNGAKNVGGDEQFKNLLVWACAEEIAHRETQGEYKEEETEDDKQDDDKE